MRVLFVPVSAARGYGEYARTREIALAVQRRWPQAMLHFVLSAQAPYASQCPFPTTLLPGSATLHTPQVVELLASFRPDLVIFDNAGRTAQLRAARACGARIVYISSRRRQRGKAFRLRWMRMIDDHWIAFPRQLAGDLGLAERLKLKILGRPRMQFLDTVLPTSVANAGAFLSLKDFVLLAPGGGTAHPGATNAPQIIDQAAQAIAARGLRTVLVGAASTGESGLLTRLPLQPQAQLVELMRRARIVVTNGGDTLLQALACGCACVAVPIAHDQAPRIARCRELGWVNTAPLTVDGICDAAVQLCVADEGRTALIGRVRTAGIRDSMPQILERITALSGESG